MTTPARPSEPAIFTGEDRTNAPVTEVSVVVDVPAAKRDLTLLTDEDAQSFREGAHGHLYEILGAHLRTAADGTDGTYFAVWAPNAKQVSVIGDFNGWDKSANLLRHAGTSGIWEGFVVAAVLGSRYKYFVVSNANGYRADKADPFAFWSEESPKTASVVRDLRYTWSDQAWLESRRHRNASSEPIAVYEVHLGSWMRVPKENNRWLTYRELAGKLTEYVQRMKFTHVELLPITEHPFYASWGYQPTGFFAPTSRYGTPQDFMYFVDYLHQNGISVILDWVPFHFPNDYHALSFFDGTHLYAHQDPRRGYHPVWRSAVFNFERPEVRSFLLSSALFWLEKYHIDGLRVDAVTYMLFHNYYRKRGEWLPNAQGGNQNIEATAFLHQFNDTIHKDYPGVLTIAEEASTWPKISRPTADGGLGFDFKWDMGWMNDTLQFLRLDGYRRRAQFNKLTFRMLYAFSENFMLALSHDEVVHCKGSIQQKMWGDAWQKFAGVRLLYGYMYGLPGKKLMFMGDEFAQIREWNHDQSLDWHLLDHPAHAGIQRCIQDLNRLYQTLPALHELDGEQTGFEWIACDDTTNGVFGFLRNARSTDGLVLVVCNFAPQAHYNYRIGVPRAGYWKEIFNGDAKEYGGGGTGNYGGSNAEMVGWHNRPFSLNLTVPPLTTLFLLSPTGSQRVEKGSDATGKS